jgi:two-component system, chemotaxis family, chemotaxis protein CheY
MRRFTILVIDDEPHIRAVLRRVFERAGYSAYEAADGLEALQIAKTTPIDVFLIDYAMPIMNGRDVLNNLRRLPGYTGTPAVMMSGDMWLDPPAETHEEPQTILLIKPLRLDQVLEVVHRANTARAA